MGGGKKVVLCGAFFVLGFFFVKLLKYLFILLL